jgi:hypothetical protein
LPWGRRSDLLEGSHTMKKVSTKGMWRLTGLLLLLATSAPALSVTDDEWSPPFNLSDWQPDVPDFRLRLGNDGTAAAFWHVENASNQWSLWARVRPPGDPWQLAANVSGTQEPFPNYLPFYWDTGVGPDGTAWLVWAGIDSAQSGDNWFVRAARLPPGGSWQSEPLTDGYYETSVRWVDLQVGPDGDLAAAWVACASSTDPTQGPCHVKVRRRPAGALSWDPVDQPDQTLGGGILRVAVLVGPGGLTVVLWQEADLSTPARWAIMARAFEPALAGGWEPSPTEVSGWKPSLYMAWPVMDPGGTVTAAWVATSADPTKEAIYASTRSADTGAWSTPAAISTARDGLYYPRLAVGQNGSVAAIWAYEPAVTEHYVFANARDVVSTWGAETLLFGGPGRRVRYWDLRVGVGPDGTATALYGYQETSHPANEDEILRWSVRPPYGGWADGGQGELGGWVGSIQSVALVVGNNSFATAVWAMEDAGRLPGEQWRVLAAVRPPDGPFEPPIVLSDWYQSAWPASSGLVVGRDGRPVLAGWYAQRADDNLSAVFYSELLPAGPHIYLPLVVRRSP